MKILFIGDYSNMHATLARELHRRGMTAHVVSDGGAHMRTEADHYLRREPGRLGGARYLYRIMQLLPELKGYDVVQLMSPLFFQLRPGKNAYFYRQLRRQNGKVCLTLAGNDHHFVDACCRGEFRYSQFRIGARKSPWAEMHRDAEREWLAPAMRDYTDYIYNDIDGAMSALYEYHAAAHPILGDRLSYTGIPIATALIEELPFALKEGKVNLFIGSVRDREVEKGTDVLSDLAHELESEYPRHCEVTEVSNLPFDEYMHRLGEATIVLDQLYSYSPATNALNAMAMGKVAASGAQPEFYRFIAEDEMRPLISLAPDDANLKETLRNLILNPEALREKNAQGRAFVEKHNDSAVVADRFIKHWERL